MYILVPFMASHVSLRLCLLLFILSSFCSPNCPISIDLSSRLLMLHSVSVFNCLSGKFPLFSGVTLHFTLKRALDLFVLK
jgi:hypothetical protein